MSKGFLGGFLAGATAAATLSFYWWGQCHKSCHTERPASVGQADDACHSLFYGDTPGADGTGFPDGVTNVSDTQIQRMTSVHGACVRLPTALYRDVVRSLPTVCVDIVCQRTSDKKILLFYRRDKPAANIWWWPGGRMYKGETFYTTAIRKLNEETGNKDSNKFKALDILSVWNTFFPDSSWDAGCPSGLEGCQTVNVTVFCQLDDASDGGASGFVVNSELAKDWAVADHKWVSVEELMQVDSYDKYVFLNMEIACKKGLFS
jgi:ADP-ribose pyrophosphatase YjhB (NUDIX family)